MPGRHFIAGFDGRPASHDALVLARALCQAAGAELTVVVAGAAAQEPQMRRKAGALLGEWPFSITVLSEAEGTTDLKELAVAEGAELIVLGSSHRSPRGRVLPGEFAERIFDHAPCAVALAPRALAEDSVQLRSMAVGYDGDRQSRVALRHAAELAEAAGASLLVLGAVEPRLGAGGVEEPTATARERERLQGQLGRALETLPGSVPAEMRLLGGSPSEVIAGASTGADLLILGSRGGYAVSPRLSLGSVAGRVVREARCATLITAAA